jgi:hypothetical protein
VVPPENGTYFFWLRSYQASEALLLLRTVPEPTRPGNQTAAALAGASALPSSAEITLIARQPSMAAMYRPQKHGALPSLAATPS